MQSIEKPTAYVYSNGTLVFDAAAVSILKLRAGQMISLCYIEGQHSLYMGEMPDGRHGTRLEATDDGGLAAYRAADDLIAIRRLPPLTVVRPRLWSPPPKGVRGNVVVIPLSKPLNHAVNAPPIKDRRSNNERRSK